MLCEKCNSNEATIHYTEVINGVKSEHHLCSECAKDMDFGCYTGILDGEFPFANIIKGILSAGGASRSQEVNPYSQVVCDQCKMSYEEFIKAGKFGCPECYNVFGPLIVDDIKKIQGSASHTGKSPVRGQKDGVDPAVRQVDGETEIGILKKQLQYALKMEEYEEAARIRDEIKRIKERKEANA